MSTHSDNAQLEHQPKVEVRRSASRARTRLPWLDSYHSFNFGRHYDPTNLPHGLLIVSNDDMVAAGGGFDTHHHSDMEIVTWVLSGALEHTDSTGTAGVIRPGLVQRMSAGTGIAHSEKNHSEIDPVHFVQMWVVPDRQGLAPRYEQFDLTDQLSDGGFVLAASGRDQGAPVTLNQLAASMWVGRLGQYETATLPAAAFVHVFLATGTASINNGEHLAAGDAVRLTNTSGTITTMSPAEIIVWEFHDALSS